MKRKDPILRLEQRLMQSGVLTEQSRDRIKGRVWMVVEEATEYAVASRYPSAEEATSHVFAEER